MLTEKQAVRHLELFILGLQKQRSIIGELGMPEQLLANMYPWTFGDKCPLPAITKVLDGAEKNGLAPMDYYNLMTVLTRFMPEVKPVVMVDIMNDGGPDIPDNLSSVLGGWEKE